MSDIFDDFLSFPRRFDEAARALSYSSYLNLGGVIFHSDISGKETITLSLSRELETHMEQVIKFGDDTSVQRLFDQVLIPETTAANSILNQEYYLVNITSVIVRFAESLDLSIDALMEEDFLNTLFTKQSLKEALSYAKEGVFKLRNQKEKTTRDSSKELMDKILHYMEENFADTDIHMEKV